MDLYQLKYFLEVARELSFTRAAANLHVSPSAVSRSIALLESSVEKKLFTRTKRHVALNSSGESLKASALRIFDEVEKAELDLAGAEAAPVRLRVGSREMITNYLLPGPLEEFEARFGRTAFGIYELDSVAMAEAVKKDLLDFGFTYAESPDPALEFQRLGRLRSHVYASRKYLKTHPVIKSLRDIPAHPFIAPRPFGADASTASADGFPDQRCPRNIKYEAEYLETHRRFVLRGLCVGVLPDLVMEEERKRGEVVLLESPPIFRDIFWFRRRNRVFSSSVDVLLKSLRNQLRSVS